MLTVAQLLNHAVPPLPTGNARTYHNFRVNPAKLPETNNSAAYAAARAERKAQIRKLILAAIDDGCENISLIAEESGLSQTTVKNHIKIMTVENILDIDKSSQTWMIRRAK